MASRLGIILTLIATVGWFWFCHYWYTCWLEQVCYSCAPAVVVDPRAPLDFQYNATDAFTNDGWMDRKVDVLAGFTGNNVLEIIAPYYADETAPEGFENMGLARAANIRALLAPDIPSDRILLKGKLITGGEEVDVNGAPVGYFEGAVFNWIDRDTTPAEPVEEFADKAMIRFPFNSVQGEYDPSVTQYLDRIADRLKAGNEKVLLTGHTDNIGGKPKNNILADRRAKMVRDILRKKGVPRKQIITKSEGENNPISTNDTDEGRHNNRRVEIQILD